MSEYSSVAWPSEVQSESDKITVHTANSIEPKDLVYRIDIRNSLSL